jgi:hypothetical protein
MQFPQNYLPYGPSLTSDWGVHESPYILVDPATYPDRAPNMPLMVQPRYGAGQLGNLGEHPDDQKWSTIILLGIVGLVMYLVGREQGKKAFVRSNPGRRRARPATRKKLKQLAGTAPRDHAGRFLPIKAR